MTMSGRGRWAGLVVLFCAVLMCSENLSAQNAGGYFPSESPEKIQPVTDSFDFVRRDVMIPMRDGVKLHTPSLQFRRAQRMRRSC